VDANEVETNFATARLSITKRVVKSVGGWRLNPQQMVEHMTKLLKKTI